MEIWIFRAALVLCSTWTIMALKQATKRAQAEHDCSFDEFNAYKTEIPLLLWLRGILGIPAYVFFIEWLLPISFLPWSYLKLPALINWTGLVFLILATSLLVWSLNSIQTNYHGTRGLHENHELVTSGAYRFIRHPIEVSFLLIHISVFLLTSNWMLGLLLVSTGTAVLLIRTPVEELYMTARFGERYDEYRQRTGKYFLKLK